MITYFLNDGNFLGIVYCTKLNKGYCTEMGKSVEVQAFEGQV